MNEEDASRWVLQQIANHVDERLKRSAAFETADRPSWVAPGGIDNVWSWLARCRALAAQARCEQVLQALALPSLAGKQSRVVERVANW